MKSIFVIIWSVLWLGPLQGYTYLEGMFLGDPFLSLDSRSLGMGGTSLGFHSAPASIRNNPGNIGLAKKITVQVNGEIFLHSEKILNITGSGSELKYSDQNINSGQYLNLSSAGLVLPVLDVFCVGLDYHQPFDFQYENTTYQYKSANQRSGLYDLSQTGSLRSFSLALACHYKEVISVGAAFNLLSGSLKGRNRLYSYPDRKSLLTDQENKTSLDGANMNIGVNTGITRNLHAGAFFQTGYKMTFKTDSRDLILGSRTKDEYYILYPKRYGIGLAYKVLTGHDALVALDFIFTPWDQDAKYKDLAAAGAKEQKLDTISPYQYLTDTYELHLGAEHLLILVPKVLRLPIRYGLMWVPSYLNDRIEMAVFTLGFGLDGTYLFGLDTRLDISLGLGKRNFIGIYGKEPYDSDVPLDLKQRIDESIQLINVSFMIEF
ncbi:MAG: hypothetical protein PHF84_09380 [bacterium]|nr:hypothetical protein [bacterium]